MVGSVAPSSIRGSLGVDRFYHPPQKRQLQQQQEQQQQQRPQQQQPPPPPRRPQQQQPRQQRQRSRPASSELRGDAESRGESDESPSRPSNSAPSSPSPPPPPPPGSNLDRFLEATTPHVRAQCLAKKGTRGSRPLDAAGASYVLADLWEAYTEWSAYGAGVPLVLNDTDDVIQYYVPYLSGMQLYIRDPNGPPPARARRPGESSDGELCRDTSIEGSANCGLDKRLDRFHEAGGRQLIVEQVSRLSLGEKGAGGMEVPYVDESDFQKESARLVFEYLERDSPYTRQPLVDKISTLVSQFPELKTYKSSDLVSSSWLSVAWYPIYRIPTGPTLRDLDACFLTFHLLSTPPRNTRNGYTEVGSSSVRKSPSLMDFSARLPLPAFGLASYKLKDSIWNPSKQNEQQQAALLQQAADDWLKKIQVELPDFRFFMSHIYRR